MNASHRWLGRVVTAVVLVAWVVWAPRPQAVEVWASSAILEEKSEDAESGEGGNADKQAEKQEDSQAAASEEPQKEGKSKESQKDEAAQAESKEAKPGEEPAVKESKPAAPPQPAPAAQPFPATHTVKRGLVKVEKKFEANFLPKDVVEVAMRFQAWTQVEVLDAVEHGTHVKKGDVLVHFKTDDLDRAIADQKRSLEAARRSLKDNEGLLAIMEKTVPFDLKSIEINLDQAEQDTKRYFDVDRELLVRSEEMSLRSAKENLEYERAELEQLEKMYKADDLTEETEELVLRRQRFAVEQAELSFLLTEKRHEQFTKIDLPRQDEAIRRDLEGIRFMAARSRITLPAMLVEQRRTVEQQRIDLERAEERLAKLEADRKLLDCRAPCDGIAYYGAFREEGQWGGSTSLESKLKPGGSVSKNEVLFTIVQLPVEKIAFKVGEADIRWMEVGLEGTIEPKAMPRTYWPVVVTEVAEIPAAADKFDVVADVTIPKRPVKIVPTMTGSVRFVVYVHKDAVLVPAKAVFTEDLDVTQRYVWVKGEGDKPEKRAVEVGESAGDSLEILDGLREGEVILLEEPKLDE